MTIIFFQINVVEILFEGRKLGSCNLQSCIPTIVLTSASYRIQTSYKTRFLDTCGTYRNNNILHTELPFWHERQFLHTLTCVPQGSSEASQKTGHSPETFAKRLGVLLPRQTALLSQAAISEKNQSRYLRTRSSPCTLLCLRRRGRSKHRRRLGTCLKRSRGLFVHFCEQTWSAPQARHRRFYV